MGSWGPEPTFCWGRERRRYRRRGSRARVRPWHFLAHWLRTVRTVRYARSGAPYTRAHSCAGGLGHAPHAHAEHVVLAATAKRKMYRRNHRCCHQQGTPTGQPPHELFPVGIPALRLTIPHGESPSRTQIRHQLDRILVGLSGSMRRDQPRTCDAHFFTSLLPRRQCREELNSVKIILFTTSLRYSLTIWFVML